MPTYEYECSQCGKTFDEYQSITAPALQDCPLCHSKKTLQRLIGKGGGILFKGSGFYETDYRSQGYRKSAEKDKKSKTPEKSSKPSKDTGKSSDAKKSK